MRHEGEYTIPFGVAHLMYIFYPPGIAGAEGELFIVSPDGEHVLVHTISYFTEPSFLFSQSGTYELDVYEEQIFLSRVETWWQGLQRFFIPSVHAALTSPYLTTLRFTVLDANAPTVPVPTCELAAVPASIFFSESATLVWSSEHAGIAAIDQGIGLVATSGSWAVSPTTTTTYTGTFAGEGGVATCSTTVSLLQGPIRELSLHERAAENAKLLVNQPDAYTFGARGWDYILGEFTTSQRIITGYNFVSGATKQKIFGTGIDCSGLVYWAFNRANNPFKAHGNYVADITADGMSKEKQSLPVAEANLRPGDVLLFRSGDGTRVGHIAMYVGESGGYDVVDAASEDLGIRQISKDVLKNLSAFAGFRRIHQNGFEGRIQSGSPVNLIVTDPEGNTLAHDDVLPSDLEYVREVPGELYYSEVEQGHDGQPKDVMYIATLKDGIYHIRVVPEPRASVDAPYSLVFYVHDVEHTLVSEQPVQTIPEGGFRVVIAGGEIAEVVEVTINTLIDELRQRMRELETNPKGLKGRLLAGVHTVSAHISRNKTTPAIAGLTALGSFVEQHRGRGITGEDADILTSLIDELLLLLSA